MRNVWIVIFLLLVVGQSFASTDPNFRLLRYKQRSEKKGFEVATSKLSPELQEQIKKVIDGILFIDFGHATPELMDLYLGRKSLDQLQFEYRYDTPEEPNAFAAFRKGHAFAVTSPALSLNFVIQLQATMAPWAQHNTATNNRYGPEFQDGLHPEQIKVINTNPYLYFLPCTKIEADVPEGTEQAVTVNGVRGVIVYPRPRDIKLETLKLIEASHPDVYKRVLDYQKNFGSEWLNKDHVLTHDLLRALLEERLARFENQRAALGQLDTAQKIESFVTMAASLQKDVISIHPFADANGRTSRMLLYYVAEREGLPPTRLTYPNEDLFWPLDMWADQVRDGMLATVEMQEGIFNQIRMNAPIGNSVALLTPVLPAEDGKQTIGEFDSYLRKQFSSDQNLQLKILQDPVGTFRSLKDNFKPSAPSCSSAFGRAS